MGKIIPKEESSKYKIEKFVFKQFSQNKPKKVDLDSIFKKAKKDKQSIDKDLSKKDEDDTKKYKELLEKIDTLSSQVVELELKLQEEQKNHQKELLKVKDEAYKQGVKDAKEQNLEQLEELKLQYLSSATKLGELELAIKEKLDSFEEELIETSIIIAKKVIKKEVEEDSSLVAKSIVKYLMESLKEDLDIEILVNPKDYEEVLKDMKKGIKVVSDSSIELGGAVLLSPKKNIDGTIKTRFEKILQLIKES